MTLYLGKQQVAMTMNHVDESAVAQKVDKVTTPNIVYGTDSNGDQTTYDKNSFGQVDDVQINGTSVVDNKVASITLGTMASETASEYTKTTNLATVATSGSYNDLSDKPSIPSAQVNSDWNATSGVAQILNKPTLGTMASENTTSYYTKTEVDGKLDDKQNIATAVNYNNITNCITEIPQDIKLELNNGTLTLKAGSKVYNVNGLLHTLTADVSLVWNYTGKFLYAYCYSLNSIVVAAGGNETVSSLPAPAKTYKLFFNTSDGKCYYDDNTIQMQECSFPIAVCNANSGIKSIDQIFNGFGYIGSTVFALPGVKGLIPNGRNADGSLKNIEFVVDKVLTRTMTTENYNIVLAFNQAGIGRAHIYYYEYNADENKNIADKTNYVKWEYCVFGYATLTNGRITSLTPKTAFHALDRNDSSTISGWAMPSSKYIDLTLGASGATYTAPANGWFSCSSEGVVNIMLSNEEFSLTITGASGYAPFGFIPVKRGERFAFSYSSNENNKIRFIYAEGEQ